MDTGISITGLSPESAKELGQSLLDIMHSKNWWWVKYAAVKAIADGFAPKFITITHCSLVSGVEKEK